MGYKTLFITESQKLKLYLDNIVVETSNGDVRFYIKDLKFVIVDNYKCSLSVQLINKLTENNVSLVMCDLSHKPFSQIIPLNGHYAHSAILRKQFEWSQDMKDKLRQRIVIGKIKSQISILKRNSRNDAVIYKLITFMNEVELADSSNREGLAAKMYFRELFGNKFIRFDDDIINAGLNYGYAIFRTLISSIAISKGLILNIGIFHIGISNVANLADDLIEVFRPIVDEYVFTNMLGIGEEILTKGHRQDLIRLTDCKIEFNGQFNTVANVISMYIDSIMRCFDNNDIEEITIPCLDEIKYDL